MPPVTIEVGRSWGHYPAAHHSRLIPVRRDETPEVAAMPGHVLPFGCGRSYGDSCLNDGGALLLTSGLDQIISLDDDGLLRCEAGITLAGILEIIVPRGWFLPVVPGTRWVTVGGAIANDIHGKNHHRAGSFGVHVTRLELLRSSGERVVCARDSNAPLFAATIGGLGLTGLILWAELRLQRVPGHGIAQERMRFGNLDEFLNLASEDAAHEHTVAWVDCLTRGRQLGRGVYFRGGHVAAPMHERSPTARPPITVPFETPGALLNRVTLGVFNELKYQRELVGPPRSVVPYDSFFFPLDAIGSWNRLYGASGFLQYQCVVPEAPGGGAIRAIMERVSASRETPTLGVLKRFGAVASPGLLSFPRPGLTLAIDFPFRGERTLRLLDDLDRDVRGAGGAVYPAKDARMSGDSFRAFFPAWKAFATHVDPRFSSSFWRRVNDA